MSTVRIQVRRGLASEWTSANPVLAAGEMGVETNTNLFKFGNGTSTWTALQYFANAAELAAIIDGAPELLNTLNELAASIGDDPNFLTNYATIAGTTEAIAESRSVSAADATAKALKDSLDAAALKLAKQGTDTTKKGSGTSMLVKRKGGMKEFMGYIQQNFRYQKPPIEYDCTINLKIVINEDGSLSDIEVVKGVRTDYNQEVLRVAKEYKGWFNDELKTNSGIKIRKLVPVIIHAPPPASF